MYRMVLGWSFHVMAMLGGMADPVLSPFSPIQRQMQGWPREDRLDKNAHIQ